MWRKRASLKSVVVGLAVLGVVAWRAWMIPRIDGRLVGRWECTTATPGRQFMTLYLRGDGDGTYTWQEDDATHVEAYPWALSGSVLQVHVPTDDSSSSRGLDCLIDRVIFAFERRRFMRSCESWNVLWITKDELCLRQRSNAAVLMFRRIPSGLDP